MLANQAYGVKSRTKLGGRGRNPQSFTKARLPKMGVCNDSGRIMCNLPSLGNFADGGTVWSEA